MDIRRRSAPDESYVSDYETAQVSSEPSRFTDRRSESDASNNNFASLWNYFYPSYNANSEQSLFQANDRPSNDTKEYPLDLDNSVLRNQDKVICYTNNMSNLPDEIFYHCSNLTELRLTKQIFYFGRGLRTLPSSISSLVNLQVLDLRGNPLKTIPSALSYLENLEELNLGNCHIEQYANELGGLLALKRLELDNNRITEPNFEKLGPNVEYLSLINNGIVKISYINSNKLTVLNLSENFIKELPDDYFKNHSALKRLYLQNNSFEKLPASITSLGKLAILDVSKNMIKELPSDLSNVKSLRYLNFAVNDVTNLPESLCEMKTLGTFLCGENPLQNPPLELASKGLVHIANYFKALEISQKVRNKRLKLMILGDIDAGKTSLAKALQGEPCCNTPNVSTIGIDFYKWKMFDIEILIIDCAGEKKYMLTHQLFLSTDIIFAITVDLNGYQMEDEYFLNKIGFWMDLIIARVPNATILIVPTRLDDVYKHIGDDISCKHTVTEKCKDIIQRAHKQVKERNNEILFEFETQRVESGKRNYLKPNLPNSIQISLKDIITVDCIPELQPRDRNDIINIIPVSNNQDFSGMESLKYEIIKIIGNAKLCPNIVREIPKTWIDLENYCLLLSTELKQCPVISSQELFEKFRFIHSKDEFHTALTYIDSIGPILYFHTIGKMKDLVFLDPLWLLKLLKAIFVNNPNEQFKYDIRFHNQYKIFETDFEADKEYLIETAGLRKSLLKCILMDYVFEEETLDQIIGLLTHFGLMHRTELDGLKFEQQPLMLVPWYFRADPPSHVMKEDISDKKQIIIKMQTVGSLPDGFFERFIIKIYSSNILISLSPWSNGVTGRTRDDSVVTCVHAKKRHVSDVKIVATGDEAVIYHAWNVVIPIIKVFEEFIDEWKGISYQIYSVCPSCYRLKHQKPNTWRLDLKKVLNREEDDKMFRICLLENKVFDKFLMRPPAVMLRDMSGEIFDDGLNTKELSGELERNEVDEISLSLADRCDELCRILDVNENLLKEYYSQKRERTYDILKLWINAEDKPSRGNLIEKLKNMRPYPCKIIEFLFFK